MQAIWTQLTYFGFFQSLFLLFIFLVSPENRKRLNGFLVFFVFVLAIALGGRSIYLSEIFGRDYRFLNVSEFATLLFGTSLFLFTRSALLGKHFKRIDLLHYLPAVIYNLVVVIYFMVPAREALGQRARSGELFWVVSILIGLGLAVNIIYWLASLRLFLQAQKKLQQEVSYFLQSQFFLRFLVAIGLCLLAWLAIYVVSLFGDTRFEIEARQYVWLPIALLILVLTYYGMREPELYKTAALLSEKKYAQSKLSNADLDLLKERLEQLMKEQKPYLNRKLLKAEVAKLLGVSNPELARLLNERIGMNFFEFINYYRIKEFVALAQTQRAKELTFFGLAQEAGFNSKTTFNKAFKQIMGTSPSQYFREHPSSTE